jgi:hypothetical protein
MLSIRELVLTAAGVGLLATSASAAVILNDPFTDGQRIGGSDPAGGSFYNMNVNNAGTTVNVVDDNAVLGSGNALSVTGRGAVGKMPASASMANVGDSVILTANFRFAAAGGQIRVGFGQDLGTQVAADYSGSTAAGSPIFADKFFGFIVLESGGNNNYTFEINTTGSPGSGAVQAESGARSAWGTTAHTLSFTVTRNSASNFQFHGLVDTSSYGSFDVNTGTVNPTLFDLVYLGSLAGDIFVDNVKVEAVPEPGSLAVIGAGAMGLLVRRRRLA